MTASSIQQGAMLTLASCENIEAQRFSLQQNGNLIALENPNLCITMSRTEKKEGRGGEPIHVMRPLSLQTCSEGNKSYQTWSLFSF